MAIDLDSELIEKYGRLWTRGFWRKRKIRLTSSSSLEYVLYDRVHKGKRHGTITEEEYLFRKLQGTLDDFKTHIERSVLEEPS